jgi:Uma2 family endonuclease
MSTVTVPESFLSNAPKIDADSLYEIINGQRVELPPMSIRAVWLASRLQGFLGPFAEQHRLGTVVTEALFILDATMNLRRRPDVAFVSSQRWPLDRDLPETGDWKIVPDLAVEIASPTDVFEEMIAKMEEYFHFGVVQVWIISPAARKVMVFESPTKVRIVSLADDLDGGTLIPGFRLPMTELFKKKDLAANGRQS